MLAGIEAARAAGFASIKLNTVAIRGFNDDELARICAWAWARGLVPRFIEEMPMADGRAYLPGAHWRPPRSARRVAAAWPGTRVVADDADRRAGAGPARYFRLERRRRPAGPPRRFGIISPMTEHFCTTCNRLRLSTAGALHACLAYDDAVDLRGAAARGRPGRGRARDPARARGQAGRAHLPAHRARRTAQGDGTNRRMIDGARLKQRIARPGARVRGAAGRAVRDPERQHGSRPPRRDGRLRDSWAPTTCARRARASTSIDTGGFPMVLGRFIQDPSFPTVTVYNHLDVQPADGDGWHTPPFKLTRDTRDGDGPTRWFARGATDDKGPALTALYGARLAIENGVRANIQFLWELEEEIGSPHFAAGPGGRRRGRRRRAGARRSRPTRSSSRTRSGSPPGSRRSRTACAA